MKKFTFSFMLLTFIFSLSVMGQDVLFLKNKTQKKVTILNIGPRWIQYKTKDKSVVYSIKSNKLKKIAFADGSVDLLGNENPRKARPFGVSGGLELGLSDDGGMFFTTFDYFIIPQVDLQLTLGLYSGEGNLLIDNPFSFGANFHLNKSTTKSPFTPYTGLHFGSDNFSLLGFAEVPLGVALHTRSGFTASLEMNWRYYGMTFGSEMSARASIGWHF